MEYDYIYQKRKEMIAKRKLYYKLLANETVPYLDELVNQAFDADETSIVLSQVEVSHIHGFMNYFQRDSERFIMFLNFIEDRGHIDLWEEYQREDARLQSYGTAGVKFPKALR